MLKSIQILFLFIVGACAFQPQCHAPVETKLFASFGGEEESLPSSPFGIIFDMDVSTVLLQYIQIHHSNLLTYAYYLLTYVILCIVHLHTICYILCIVIHYRLSIPRVLSYNTV